MNADDGLEDIRWVRGLGGKKLPAASYALLPNLKKRSILGRRRGIDIFWPPGFYTAAPKCVLVSDAWPYQTPGRRPLRITDSFVNTVTRGLVGAPNERTPFRFDGAVVGLSINVCRGLGISSFRLNIWLSFSKANFGPTSAQELLFSFFFQSLELFFPRFVLIASGTVLWRVSLKVNLFLATSRSIVIGLNQVPGIILYTGTWGKRTAYWHSMYCQYKLYWQYTCTG